MRRVAVTLTLILTVALSVGAQDEAATNPNLTHGDFAVLLLKAGQPQVTPPAPNEALRKCQELTLMPSDWTPDGMLTHGELADVVGRYGVVYTPAGRDDPVSRAFAEAFLRRHIGQLRDFISLRLGHETAVTHVMDLGIDRAVSPSDFE
jgi:hypothetical protein